MKRIAVFSIPAHGHTNPMLPVVSELVKHGNKVRFYSFDEFGEKIRATGADFISCNEFLGKVTEQEEKRLKKVSTTEMSIQDLRITVNMNDFLEKEFADFKPDVVYTDSVCFWGKLNALKHKVPMVVSTSTFAFNQLSSQYMKHSAAELADMIFGLPKISKELKKLEPYGYKVKGVLSLVQSDNNTDSVVYATKKFQPYSEVFSEHYAFVGPSVYTDKLPDKKKERPLVYISMGTVINNRPDFYKKCIEALKDMQADVVISCGKAVNPEDFGELPQNISVYPYVNQLEILSKTDVFITHCGMNSVSESLYMATPMVLYPQTGEQFAVARRAAELGAGVMLKDDSAKEISKAVSEILNNSRYSESAEECSEDFRNASGTTGAADFIESAPHDATGKDIIVELNKANGKFQLFYWLVVIVLIILFCIFIGVKYSWIVGATAGIISTPLGKYVQGKNYQKLTGIK
ncbi:MAG: glycosyl transferase [Ruminococcus sp.]|nr:glycosyl transferase [Ruminococcus sp.]